MKAKEYIDLMMSLAEMAKEEIEEIYDEDDEDRACDIVIGIDIMKEKIKNSEFLLETMNL